MNSDRSRLRWRFPDVVHDRHRIPLGTESDIGHLVPDAYGVPVPDALQAGQSPAIRHHDGERVLSTPGPARKPDTSTPAVPGRPERCLVASAECRIIPYLISAAPLRGTAGAPRHRALRWDARAARASATDQVPRSITLTLVAMISQESLEARRSR